MLNKKPNLIKPHIGGDTDVWGNKLNENIDKQDVFNQTIIEDSVTQYQEIARLDEEKINRSELNTLVQNTIDNYVDENTKPKLNEHVENVNKPELNRYVDVKKEELSQHEKTKETELDLHTSKKKEELNTYSKNKETELNNYTEEQKNELDIYEQAKEVQLNEFKDVKNVEITNHTNSEIERINATGIDGKVSKSGDTMTGTLIIESQEDHKLIIKSTSDNKENYILGRDASGNSLFYVGKGSISNNDISMYNYRNNKGIALTDLGVVFTGEPYAGNYRVYHEGYKPTASAVGAFNYIQMLTEVPKTFNGVTQVPNNSPDYTYLAGGGSQHFILQATTDDTYPDNAYVGQIGWGYNADDPKIAIRCKNPSKNGQWEPLLRYKDVFGQTGHISGHTYMTDVFQSSYIHAFPASGERDPKALYIRTGSINSMQNFKFTENGAFELNGSIFTAANTLIKGSRTGYSLYADTNNCGFLDNENKWLLRVNKNTNKAYIRDKEILIGCPYDVGDVLTTTNENLNPATKWVGTTWKKWDGTFYSDMSNKNVSLLEEYQYIFSHWIRIS